jgi:hypothetical protein
MLEDLAMIVEKLGIPASVIIALFWGFNKQQSTHSSERQEWREDSKLLHEKSNKVFSESTDAINNLTEAIKSNNKKRKK